MKLLAACVLAWLIALALAGGACDTGTSRTCGKRLTQRYKDVCGHGLRLAEIEAGERCDSCNCPKNSECQFN